MSETIKQKVEETDPHVCYARIRGEQLAKEIGPKLAFVLLVEEFSNPLLLRHAQRAAQSYTKK